MGFLAKIIWLFSSHISTLSPGVSCKYFATSTGKVIFSELPTLFAVTSNLMGISIYRVTV
jgi:hypothetical protein